MRIVIAKTADAGGGFDHYTTDRAYQGALMSGYKEHDNGLQVLLEGAESRIYPWTSIAFFDHFPTPSLR